MGLLFSQSKTSWKYEKTGAQAIVRLCFVIFFSLGLNTAAFAKEKCLSIKLTAHPNDPPASWVNSKGKLVGASITLAEQLLTRLGVSQFETVAFSTAGQAVQATLRGDIDLIVALGMTVDRNLQFNYVLPAYYTKLVAVVVRNNEGFRLLSYDDLKNRRGTSGASITFGQGAFGKLIGVEIATEQSFNIKESFEKLLSGEVDYNLLYRRTAEAWIVKNNLWNKVDVLPVLAGSNDYFMAWSKLSKCRDKKFFSDFSKALFASNNSEVFADLLTQYEGKYVEELLLERKESLSFDQFRPE